MFFILRKTYSPRSLRDLAAGADIVTEDELDILIWRGRDVEIEEDLLSSSKVKCKTRYLQSNILEMDLVFGGFVAMTVLNVSKRKDKAKGGRICRLEICNQSGQDEFEMTKSLRQT